MAELAGVFAASHGPMIVRNWEKLTAGEKERLDAAFLELGRRIRAARPDVLVVISPDHWVNFFLDNLPAICVGTGLASRRRSRPCCRRATSSSRCCASTSASRSASSRLSS